MRVPPQQRALRLARTAERRRGLVGLAGAFVVGVASALLAVFVSRRPQQPETMPTTARPPVPLRIAAAEEAPAPQRDTPVQEAREPLPRYAHAATIGMCAGLAAAAAIAIAEIDRMIASVGPGGTDYTSADIAGAPHWIPHVAEVLRAWAGITNLEGRTPLVPWLGVQLALDVFVIAGLAGVLAGLFCRLRVPRARFAVIAYVVMDLLEDVLALVVVLHLPETGQGAGWQPGPVPAVLAVVTLLKWLALVVNAALLAHAAWIRHVGVARSIAQVVKKQRFGLLVVTLLAVFMLMPARNGGLFDEAPDLARAWFDGSAWLQGVIAVAAFALLLGLLRWLNLLRSADALNEQLRARRVRDHEEAFADLSAARRGFVAARPWILLIVVVAVVTVALSLLSHAVPAAVAFEPQPAVYLVVVLAALGTVSVVLRVRHPALPLPPVHAESRAGFIGTHRLGVAIVWLVPCIFGLLIVRAMAPMAAHAPSVLTIGAALAGVGIAVGVWPLAVVVARHDEQWILDRRTDRPTSPLGWRVAFAGALMVTLELVFMIFPLQAGAEVGGLAMIAIGLGCFAGTLIVLASIQQALPPAPVFAWIRMRRTPILAILVAVAGFASFVDQPAIHDLHDPAASVAAARAWTHNGDPVAAWLSEVKAHPRACTVPVGSVEVGGTSRQLRVRPLIMLSASGGGIRAAYWTTTVIDHLAAVPCLAHSIVLASGVSGSSVGLAVAATTPLGSAQEAVGRMAASGPLSADVDGLFTTDLLGGSFGLTLGAVGMSTPPDRAALLTRMWSQAAPGLDRPFPFPRQPDAADPLAATGDTTSTVPWATVFNSTSAVSGCRVAVADFDTRPAGDRSTPEVADCARNTAAVTGGAATVDPIAGAYNLFAAEPCLVGLPAASAALLSARFGYISPSAVVHRCGTDNTVDQLIDGGYAENTGLATLNSVLTTAVPQIQAHNAAALAAPGTKSIDLVVPEVIAIDNDPFPLLIAPDRTTHQQNEPLLVITSKNRGGASLATEDTLLTTAEGLRSAALPSAVPKDADTSAIDAAITQAFGTGVMQVAPVYDGDVPVPLGWSLSMASEHALQRAYDRYAGLAFGCAISDARCEPAAQYRALVSDMRSAPE